MNENTNENKEQFDWQPVPLGAIEREFLRRTLILLDLRCVMEKACSACPRRNGPGCDGVTCSVFQASEALRKIDDKRRGRRRVKLDDWTAEQWRDGFEAKKNMKEE